MLVLCDSWLEIEKRYVKWTRVLADKSLKMNVSKTKAFLTGQSTISLSIIFDVCAVHGMIVECNPNRHKYNLSFAVDWC